MSKFTRDLYAAWTGNKSMANVRAARQLRERDGHFDDEGSFTDDLYDAATRNTSMANIRAERGHRHRAEEGR
jgi:hypothetical protein